MRAFFHVDKHSLHQPFMLLSLVPMEVDFAEDKLTESKPGECCLDLPWRGGGGRMRRTGLHLLLKGLPCLNVPICSS